MNMGKRKRRPIVRCGTSSSNAVEPGRYDKYFCLCSGTYNDSHNIKQWYMLHVSSDKDKEKAEKEINGKRLVWNIPTPEQRAVHLVVNHDERHRGEKPPVLPLMAELETGKADRHYGTCSAIVGSKIYRFGGSCKNKDGHANHWSRKVIYFDVNHPEKGWKKGPHTICGRADAAVVVLHEKIYVFGGNRPNIPGLCSEFLDATLLEEEGEGEGKWSALQRDCPASLGFQHLFAAAAALDGKILVGSKETGDIFMYDVTHQFWKRLALDIDFGAFITNPILVGTAIYWIEFNNSMLYACDLVQQITLSMPIGDFEICQQINKTCDDPDILNLTLRHLADDVFCMLWIDNLGLLLHCTVVRVSTTEILGASVLCCHSYRFEHETSFIDCLPLQPSLLSSIQRSMDMGKRKKGAIVRCGTSSNPEEAGGYDRYFCLCSTPFTDKYNIKQWFLLNLSSNKDTEKAEKEFNGKRLVKNVPNPEQRAFHLAFNHDERHQGEKPALLSLITELEKGKSDHHYGTCSAIVGSRIYRFGGGAKDKVGHGVHWSRKVIYFDVNHPDKGWKKGPPTICGRAEAAVVAVDGKIFVFGGNDPEFPGICCEFLDSTSGGGGAEEEAGGGGGSKGKSKWSPLQHDAPSSLGFEELFAAAIDGGNILVGSKGTGALFMLDVAHQSWKRIARGVDFGIYTSNVIVVGTAIYWIDHNHPQLRIYDFVHGTELSVNIADSMLCEDLSEACRDTHWMNLTLRHLADDLFCMLWIDNADLLIHCTILRVSTKTGATVVCCHSYQAHQKIWIQECLPVDPSFLRRYIFE